MNINISEPIRIKAGLVAYGGMVYHERQILLKIQDSTDCTFVNLINGRKVCIDEDTDVFPVKTTSQVLVEFVSEHDWRE